LAEAPASGEVSALSRIVTHYLEVIVRRAELPGFDEMRAEIESAGREDDEHIAVLERQVRDLQAMHPEAR
jgi:hypothetical protein